MFTLPYWCGMMSTAGMRVLEYFPYPRALHEPLAAKSPCGTLTPGCRGERGAALLVTGLGLENPASTQQFMYALVSTLGRSISMQQIARDLTLYDHHGAPCTAPANRVARTATSVIGAVF